MTASAPDTSPPAEPRRVLVIDDEEAILRSLERFLLHEGFAVDTALTGAEGLSALRRLRHPVVLLDIRLPGMDGLDVLSEIRNAFPDAEVIMVSGHGEMKDAIAALRRGAANYLQKPVDFEELLITLRRAFERRAAAEEHRRVRDQLYHAQKMDALGVLAGGVAHEINNLMGGIIGYCEMALGGTDPELREKALRVGLDASRKACETAGRLLHFARRGGEGREPHDLNELAGAALDLLAREWEADGIAVETDLVALPPVFVEPSEIQQVFLNLFVNARQSLAESRLGRRAVRLRTWAEGEWVFAAVEDNGPGIPPAYRGRVFEPFFTTRGVASGGNSRTAAGLGLAMAHGILRDHGGSIDLASEPDEKTVFTLRLPRAGREGVMSPVHVLAIDDDTALRRILQAVLAHAGYDVETAEDGRAGLALVRRRVFDLVLLDQMMPDLSGLEVLAELRRIAPDLPVLMLTALRCPELAREAVAAGARECLAKPVNNERLIFLVRKYGARDDALPRERLPLGEVEPSRKHILVAEGDGTVRDVYALILSRRGFRVTACGSAAEAEEKMRGSYFDLVLLDMALPGTRGAETVRRLRALNPYTPLVLSGQVSDGALRESLRAGATRALLKPIQAAGLVEEVTALLALYDEPSPGE